MTDTVNIGIEPEARQQTADALAKVLADTYTLYIKVQGFHWNVTGPQFNALHNMFEEQYIDLRDAADEIAERMRALGAACPGSFAQLLELTAIKEQTEIPSGTAMVKELLADHETVSRTAKAALQTAEQAGDDASGDMMVQRMQVHDKTAWMLRSMVA